MSTRGLALHRQTAVVQSPTAAHEPQNSSSTQTLSAQRVVQGSPLEQPAQYVADTLAGSGFYACIFPGCNAQFDTSARLVKHRRESHQASPDGPALLPTTAASSIAYNSMLRVQQPSSAGASELDNLLNVPGFSPVEKGTTPTEATHDYSEIYSSDASTLSYPRSSSPSNDPLHSSPSLGAVHPRIGNDYMVRGPFSKIANELIHE